MSIIRQENLYIDSLNGGNGDIWMRLVSFYSLADLFPQYKIHLLIPPFIRNLASFTFGDRLVISNQETFPSNKFKYTTLGIKDLLIGIIKGERYITPYQRAVIKDKGKQQIKDWLNISIFNTFQHLGLVSIPAWKYINYYQGYLEIIGIKTFMNISYDRYVIQLKSDYDKIFIKLNGPIPISKEFSFPKDIKDKVVVFPNGTSRQFMPASWGQRHLPDAYYAFFHKDKDAEVYKKRGLKTINFYQEPGDIILLSTKAKWTVTTDSFPSHLIQYSSKKCTITITEVLKSRIISPVFKGKVIDSEVSCHPCLHLDRKNHTTCMAGFEECQNWFDQKYNENILKSIPL